MLNKGISFGMFPDMPVWILGIVLMGLIVYAVKVRELWGKVGLFLMIIGGTGNLYSRVMYGGAIDYWNFFGLFYNNAWDYLIAGGVVTYIISKYLASQ